MTEVRASGSLVSGQGGVIQPEPGNAIYAAGGVLHGTGFVTQPDGSRSEFSFQSEPLTQEQADKLNQKHRSDT